MSSLNKKSSNPSKIIDNIKKIQSKNKSNFTKYISLKKKTHSLSDIKHKQEDIKINNNFQNHYKQNNNINNNQNSNKKLNNKQKKIPNKKHKKISNNIIQKKKQFRRVGSIESYPSILSTDTLTIKNNNINLSKKKAEEFIFSFNYLNNKLSKESCSCTDIKSQINNSIKNNDNSRIFRNNMNRKVLSELTTAEKNDNKKNISKSEQNDTKNKNDRFKKIIKQNDIDKIKFNFKLDNIPSINEIDTINNNSERIEKSKKLIEPEFLKEIKQKNIIKIRNSSSNEKYNTFNTISLNLSSNTTNNKIQNNFKNFNLGTHTFRNRILSYKTYYKNIGNNNYYYIMSPISTTFKQINSKKSNRMLNDIQRPLEEINEDEIDTVKQENTFGCSKIDSITSETLKEIQKPKNCVYFFEVPEEENYSHIQGPIEFEYANSSEPNSLNSKDEIINVNNCSRLNNINIYKIEEKEINKDDDDVNYYDNMKENDEFIPNKKNNLSNNLTKNINNNINGYINYTINNSNFKNINKKNNNINNVFNSISTINEKTISNNGSFSNLNLKINNELLSPEIINIERRYDINENNIDDKNEHKYKKVKSYQKKIIKDNFDFNKPKSYKSSTRINQNFSEIKQKKILYNRLKYYKIEIFVGIIKKIIKIHIKKIFNRFKGINLRIKQFIFLVDKIYYIKNKKEFYNQLLKLNDNFLRKDFPLFIPYKNYPINQNNCNMFICDYNNDNNQINPVPNDNDELNHSFNIYYDKKRIIPKIKINNTQKNLFKKPILNNNYSADRTNSYFYKKKIGLLGSKNTIPSGRNIGKKTIQYKRNLIPKIIKKDYKTEQKRGNKNEKIINNINENTNNKEQHSERKINNLEINEKSDKDNNNNNIGDNEDEILEQAYRYKIFDENRCSNGNYHRNTKSEIDDSAQKKIDSLKTYFFKEIEKLEFPDNNDINSVDDKIEGMASF